MWMTSIVGDERLKSVVFFLSDALRSVLEDGEALKDVRCGPPSISPDASCDDIFSQLEIFRKDVTALRGREAFMIAKLARARQWAYDLKPLAPTLKPEISLFLLGTVFCDELQQAILPSPQSAFHGGSLSRRFLGERMREMPSHTAPREDAAPPASVAYIIAGKVRVEDLTHACEQFLIALEEHYSLYGEPLDDADASDAILDLLDIVEGNDDFMDETAGDAAMLQPAPEAPAQLAALLH